ncbi:hypothetical protein TNCV_1019531 [Trichonephila clavipes]|nr:hypothetical protein TNCV_1019531 [Trichonephila clavipes]
MMPFLLSNIQFHDIFLRSGNKKKAAWGQDRKNSVDVEKLLNHITLIPKPQFEVSEQPHPQRALAVYDVPWLALVVSVLTQQELNSPVSILAHFKPWAQKIYRPAWHWRIEIYNQRMWLSPAYPALLGAPSALRINRHWNSQAFSSG